MGADVPSAAKRVGIMTRAVLIACVPWLAMLAASVAVLYLLARASRARPDWRQLLRLHADQGGSAQTLSFVLALPLFVMVLMFIVQVSQLMIGQIVVEYAAYASARAAAVWIPADLSQQSADEGPNCVAGYAAGTMTTFETDVGGMSYLLYPTGLKYDKIRLAALLGCMSVCPSRDLGASLSSDNGTVAAGLTDAYNALTQTSAGATARRIQNKLAYADAFTSVDVRFFHVDPELPPNPLGGDAYSDELGLYFRHNEVGWRDPITVTVTHHLALLPGPGRLLAHGTPVAGVEGSQGSKSNVYTDKYTYPLTATATVGNEGEKPVVSYAY
jgi:hypothetical protein